MHERCGMVSERGLLHMGNAKERIESGKAVLGIEFGSTRIKAVLVDETHQPIASGAHDWENQLVDGIWTYSLDMIWDGLRDCYRKMTEDVTEQIRRCRHKAWCHRILRNDARLYAVR